MLFNSLAWRVFIRRHNLVMDVVLWSLISVTALFYAVLPWQGPWWLRAAFVALALIAISISMRIAGRAMARRRRIKTSSHSPAAWAGRLRD